MSELPENSVLEEARNIALNAPVFAGDTISHQTAEECRARFWAVRDDNSDWRPTEFNPFYGLQAASTGYTANSMEEKYEIDFTLQERDRAIRDSAKLANALRDIHNDIGEMAEVKAAYKSVDRLVSEYAGLHNFGETQ